jgi:geranylgeranyl pyrophosphate synthase
LARAAGATALVGGQAADLHVPKNPDTKFPGINDLQAIHNRKTGALFVAATELGGIVAGASPYQLAALHEYAERIGLAFQITDDLLDVAGDQSAVGKRVAKDADNGKMTFPAVLGIEESRRRAAALVDEACDIIEELGPTAHPLVVLARFICSRTT